MVSSGTKVPSHSVLRRAQVLGGGAQPPVPLAPRERGPTSKAGAGHLGHFIHAYECLWVAGRPPEVSVCSHDCQHQPSGHCAEQGEQGPGDRNARLGHPLTGVEGARCPPGDEGQQDWRSEGPRCPAPTQSGVAGQGGMQRASEVDSLPSRVKVKAGPSGHTNVLLRRWTESSYLPRSLPFVLQIPQDDFYL